MILHGTVFCVVALSSAYLLHGAQFIFIWEVCMIAVLHVYQSVIGLHRLISPCFLPCRNIIHGSDGPETAKDEINLWFKPEDLVSYSSNAEKWIYGE